MKRILAAVLMLAMALSLGAVPALAAPADVQYSFEETVPLDNDDVKVTVTEFKPDEGGRPTFTMLYENKTDKDLRFAVMDTYLDGRKCTAYGSEEVAAGQQAYCDMYWYEDDLAEKGINYINDVMIDLWIYYDGDSIETVFEDTVSWSVNAVSDTPSLTDLTFGHGFTEVPVLSGDYTAVVKDFDPDGVWDDGAPSLVFYLENNTEEDVVFMAEDVCINGVMCDPYWSQTVPAGTSAYDYYFYWYEDELAEAHIESFDSVEFDLAVKDAETFDDLVLEPVTIDLSGLGAAVAAPAEEAEEDAALALEEGMDEETARALEEDAARAAAEEGLTEEPEEPAEETAGPVDVAALAGSLDPDNPVYTNEVFGMSCSFDPSWGVMTEEKLAASVGWDEASGTDPVEYLGEYLIGGNAATVMYIISPEKDQIVSIPVNAFTGAGQLQSSTAAAGRNLMFFTMSGGSAFETLGMSNCEMEPNTVTINGVDYDGIHFEYDHVDQATGETVAGYTEWLFLVCNDYENDQDLVMTIRINSYGEDHIADMLSMLTMPADG